MAGVKFDAHYNLTTVDPPELVRFIKTFDDVKIEKPEMSMWRLVIDNLSPPTRLMRYCCRVLKERGGEGRTKVMGIRWEESPRRSKREVFEKAWDMENTFILNPIIDWAEQDVWEFIKQNNLPYCKLYDVDGYDRLGCIGCPFKSSKAREKDFERYPKYKEQYLRTFEKMLQKRREKGLKCKWQTAEDVMNWWIYGKDKFEDGGIFKHIRRD